MLRIEPITMYEDTSEERNPERNMVLALMERAMRDLTSPCHRERMDAAYWVLHTGEEYFFSFDSIVELLDWSTDTVSKIEQLAQAACGNDLSTVFEVRGKGGRQKSITEDNETGIREMWDQGYTILMICEEFKIGQNAVRAYLKKENLYKRRHPNGKNKKEK